MDCTELLGRNCVQTLVAQIPTNSKAYLDNVSLKERVGHSCTLEAILAPYVPSPLRYPLPPPLTSDRWDLLSIREVRAQIGTSVYLVLIIPITLSSRSTPRSTSSSAQVRESTSAPHTLFSHLSYAEMKFVRYVNIKRNFTSRILAHPPG